MREVSDAAAAARTALERKRQTERSKVARLGHQGRSNSENDLMSWSDWIKETSSDEQPQDSLAVRCTVVHERSSDKVKTDLS